MVEIIPGDWELFLEQHKDSHLLQSTAWGQLKSEFGWQVVRVKNQTCGAQILIRQIVPGIRFAYIPKGPIGNDWKSLIPEIDATCRQRKCAFVKIEPDLWIDASNSQDTATGKAPDGFILGSHCIQPLQTLIVNISGDEAQILGRMKQKTRYNINLALKKNVLVKAHSDLGTFYHLMTITSQRDQFGIHSLHYYQRAFELFENRGQCRLLVAEYESEPIAALIVFSYGPRAWYFYGASSNSHRDKMPNYLLQWEAMRWARVQGCVEYDLWGIPNKDLTELEANFTKMHKGLWGVYRFKRGFGGELKKSAGPWDRVYTPLLYRVYQMVMKLRASEG